MSHLNDRVTEYEVAAQSGGVVGGLSTPRAVGRTFMPSRAASLADAKRGSQAAARVPGGDRSSPPAAAAPSISTQPTGRSSAVGKMPWHSSAVASGLGAGAGSGALTTQVYTAFTSSSPAWGGGTSARAYGAASTGAGPPGATGDAAGGGGGGGGTIAGPAHAPAGGAGASSDPLEAFFDDAKLSGTKASWMATTRTMTFQTKASSRGNTTGGMNAGGSPGLASFTPAPPPSHSHSHSAYFNGAGAGSARGRESATGSEDTGAAAVEATYFEKALFGDSIDDAGDANGNSDGDEDA